eukprot:2535915-Pyramimonas_sp.AAC.1
MAGEGGRASKKRRMAQMVVRTLDLSQRVAASGLREAKEQPDSDTDSPGALVRFARAGVCSVVFSLSQLACRGLRPNRLIS